MLHVFRINLKKAKADSNQQLHGRIMLGLSNKLEKCIVKDEVNDFNDC